jgi:hypothetical protein
MELNFIDESTLEFPWGKLFLVIEPFRAKFFLWPSRAHELTIPLGRKIPSKKLL